MKLVHWPLMGELLRLVQYGGDWAVPQPTQAPPRCTKCNSPPINGQCTNHHTAVSWCVKGLTAFPLEDWERPLGTSSYYMDHSTRRSQLPQTHIDWSGLNGSELVTLESVWAEHSYVTITTLITDYWILAASVHGQGVPLAVVESHGNDC